MCYHLFQLTLRSSVIAAGVCVFKYCAFVVHFSLCGFPYKMTLATCPVQLLSISQVEDVATMLAVLWEHGLETQSNTGASGAVCSCNVTAICDTLI